MQTANPGDALGAGVRAFFSFLDSDRAAWAFLFDETLPTAARSRRVAEYEAGSPSCLGALLAQLPTSARRARVEVEALSHRLLGRRGARSLCCGPRRSPRDAAEL